MSTVPSPLVGGSGAPYPSISGSGIRPLSPSTGDYGNNFLNTLGNYNTETGVTSGRTGASTFGAGVQAMQPALNFFQKLLGGNEELQSALQPEFDQISQQFDQIRNSISATQPRGGGTASAMVQAPFQEAATKGEIASKARTDAASQLQKAGYEEASLGQGEQGIGLQALGEALQGALGNKGLNISTDFANQFQTIANGLNALI